MYDEMYIGNLGEFIEGSVTPFHTVNSVENVLKEHGFIELKKEERFNIKSGGKYFVNIYDSSLMAFTIGGKHDLNHKMNLRCSASHTDFPCFKIKPNYLIKEHTDKEAGYIKINTEVYGGPILSTWLDRPLSVAGKIVVKSTEWFDNETIVINVKKPLLTIPNLAIHMNRNVNKGVELNCQKDMLPIAGLISKDGKCENIIENIIVNELKKQGRQIEEDDIKGYELYVYQTEKGCMTGIDDELYSSPRLDNLTSVYAQVNALVNAQRENGINMAMFYDNEEIGSRTKQGAASQMIMFILEKIYMASGYDREYMINDILGGMMISLDVAHATHPNSSEKSDSTNKVILNGGIVIKQAANQSYANDAEGISMIKNICEDLECKYQVFVNRSDMIGGQTLGSIGSSVLPMRTIDIGIPLLAMHSARELMGTDDEKNLEKFLTGYYS